MHGEDLPADEEAAPLVLPRCKSNRDEFGPPGTSRDALLETDSSSPDEREGRPRCRSSISVTKTNSSSTWLRIPKSVMRTASTVGIVVALLLVYAALSVGEHANPVLRPGLTVRFRSRGLHGPPCGDNADALSCIEGGVHGVYEVLDGGGFFDGTQRVHLKSVPRHRYCSYDGWIKCTELQHAESETFVAHNVGKDLIALRSYQSGKFCSAAVSGEFVGCSADSIGPQETYWVECVGGCSQPYGGADVKTCKDVPGWTNGDAQCRSEGHGDWDGCSEDGWTCAGYSLNGWCRGGSPDISQMWASYPMFKDPAQSCCVCGKGEARWMLVIGSSVAFGAGAEDELKGGWARLLGETAAKRRIFPVNIAEGETSTEYWLQKGVSYIEARSRQAMDQFSLVVLSLSFDSEQEDADADVNNIDAAQFLKNYRLIVDILRGKMAPGGRLVVGGPYPNLKYNATTLTTARDVLKEMKTWTSPDYVIDFLGPQCANTTTGHWLANSSTDAGTPNEEGHKQMLQCADAEKVLGEQLWAR